MSTIFAKLHRETPINASKNAIFTSILRLNSQSQAQSQQLRSWRLKIFTNKLSSFKPKDRKYEPGDINGLTYALPSK